MKMIHTLINTQGGESFCTNLILVAAEYCYTDDFERSFQREHGAHLCFFSSLSGPKCLQSYLEGTQDWPG